MAFKGRSKICNLGCDTKIAWYHDDATEDEFYAEIDEKGQFVQRHKCPNWNSNSNNKLSSYEELRQNQRVQKVREHLVELQVIPLAEANKLLSIGGIREYELVGSDPVKVVHDQFFVVMGRKSFDSNQDNFPMSRA